MKNQPFRNLVAGGVAVTVGALLVMAGKGQDQPPPAVATSKPYVLTVRFHGTESKRDFLHQEIALAEADPFKVVTAVGDDTYTLSGKITTSKNDKMLDIAATWSQVEERFPDGQKRTRSRRVNTQVTLEVKGEEKQIGGMSQPVPKDPAVNLAIYVALRPVKGE